MHRHCSLLCGCRTEEVLACACANGSVFDSELLLVVFNDLFGGRGVVGEMFAMRYCCHCIYRLCGRDVELKRSATGCHGNYY